MALNSSFTPTEEYAGNKLVPRFSLLFFSLQRNHRGQKKTPLDQGGICAHALHITVLSKFQLTI